MSIKGERKAGLRSTSPFRQMEKVGGKQCGSNAEQLLTHKERKGGKQMWKRKTKKHSHIPPSHLMYDSFGSLKKKLPGKPCWPLEAERQSPTTY